MSSIYTGQLQMEKNYKVNIVRILITMYDHGEHSFLSLEVSNKKRQQKWYTECPIFDTSLPNY